MSEGEGEDQFDADGNRIGKKGRFWGGFKKFLAKAAKVVSKVLEESEEENKKIRDQIKS